MKFTSISNKHMRLNSKCHVEHVTVVPSTATATAQWSATSNLPDAPPRIWDLGTCNTVHKLLSSKITANNISNYLGKRHNCKLTSVNTWGKTNETIISTKTTFCSTNNCELAHKTNPLTVKHFHILKKKILIEKDRGMTRLHAGCWHVSEGYGEQLVLYVFQWF
jgi:hypothetical protein